jgi:hypothetical protein
VLPNGGFGAALVVGGTNEVGGTGGRAPDEPPGSDVLSLIHGIVDAPRVRLCFRAGSGRDARLVETPTSASALEFGQRLVLHELDGVDFASEDVQPLAITGELELVEDLDCAEALDRARFEQAVAPPPDNASGGASGNGGAGGSGGALVEGGSENLGLEAQFDSHEVGSGGVGGVGGAGGAAGAEPPLPDPPRLRVGELPTVPAGTLATGRSFLLVLNGCIGGPAFGGRFADDACGPGYTPERPTLSAVLVPMSRRSRFDALGLQVVHASRATGAVGIRSIQEDADIGASFTITDGLELGVIAPRVARTELSRIGWGAGLPDWRVEVYQGSATLFGQDWSEVLERGGLDSVEDGMNYVLVLVGPRFDLRMQGFWNPPQVTIAASNPEE